MACFDTPLQVTKIWATIICTEAKWRLLQMYLLFNRLFLLLLYLLLSSSLFLLIRDYSVPDVPQLAKVSPWARCVTVANDEGINTDIFKHHNTQGDSGGICNTLGNDSMCDSKQKSSYEHGSDFGRLRSYDRLKLRIEGNDYWQ